MSNESDLNKVEELMEKANDTDDYPDYNHMSDEYENPDSVRSFEIGRTDGDEEEDEADQEAALDLSVKFKSSLQSQNKRKKKPIKSSLLLLKCVESNLNNDDDVDIEVEPEMEGNQNLTIEDTQTNNSDLDLNYDYSNHDSPLSTPNENNFDAVVTSDKCKKKTLSSNGFIGNKNIDNYQEISTTKSPISTPKSYQAQQQQQSTPVQSSKKQMRFQCRFCVYKSHSVSLMQNHIYRHIDTTPYSCFYCGHKSTTKSTIMVHIELCHPNMEVKIKESRVKEEDYYLDLNSAGAASSAACPTGESKSMEFLKENKLSLNKFEIIPNKCHMTENKTNTCLLPPPPPPPLVGGTSLHSLSSASLSSNLSSSSSTSSSISSVCSSPSVSPAPQTKEEAASSQDASKPNQFDAADEHKEPNSYVTVFNRPKQYFGSLYEPDKQYSCKLCTYTTNHKPSMEDHVYVHTNKRPYRCGYCDEEIYTRYAATYHNKYKHPGEARNFIKDEQDVSIYYVNRAKGSSSSTSNATNSNGSTSSGNVNSFAATNHQNNGDHTAGNENEETFHQYGVVAQHRVLDSKQRCPQYSNTQVKTSPVLDDKSEINKKQKLKQKPSMQSPTSSSSSSASSATSQPLNAANSSDTDLIKVTSFKATMLPQSTSQTSDDINKKHAKKAKTNNSNEFSQLDSQSQQFLLPNQNQLALNAFSNYFLNNPSFLNTPTSPSSAPVSVASALTQFMLSSNMSTQQQQLPNGLASMFNPLQQSFNSASSPSSSNANSNSSSLSTSPSTSGNNNQLYDFNLAIKMYQIQLQNLMTANYLQTFRNNMGSSNTTQSNGSGYEIKKESNAKKRKLNQVDDVPEEEDECDEEGHGEDKQTGSNSSKSSPQHSPSGCHVKGSGSKNSLKFKTASSYNNPAKLMKKSSKHIM